MILDNVVTVRRQSAGVPPDVAARRRSSGSPATSTTTRRAPTTSSSPAGSSPGVTGPQLATVALPSDYTENALFGDITWNPTRELSLTGGMRSAKNKQTFTQISDGPLVGGVDRLHGRLRRDDADLPRDGALRAHADQQRLRARGERLPAGRPERRAQRPGDRPAARAPHVQERLAVELRGGLQGRPDGPHARRSRPRSTTSTGRTSSRSRGERHRRDRQRRQGARSTARSSRCAIGRRAQWTRRRGLRVHQREAHRGCAGPGSAGRAPAQQREELGHRAARPIPSRPAATSTRRSRRALRGRAQRGFRWQRHAAQLQAARLHGGRPARRRATSTWCRSALFVRNLFDKRAQLGAGDQLRAARGLRAGHARRSRARSACP